MITNNNTTLQEVAAHHVGSKAGGEGLLLSAAPVSVGSEASELLLRYFLSSFKTQEYYTLRSEGSASDPNAVYDCVCAIFDNPETLVEQSVALAKRLYEQGSDNKIKGGDFFVAYLKDCMVDGETLDAVGLFKSENQEAFLKLQLRDERFYIKADSGISINKPDRGCLIFNTEREEGFLVAITGNSRSISEEQYWTDCFLNAVQRKDDFFRTQQAISLCKSFVTQRLPEAFEVSKADQADMLNKSVKFFKENDSFSVDEFAQEVIADPEAIKSFKSYKREFDRDSDDKIPEQFDISEAAVKRQARTLKSVIKLDKNFHIYVHGKREYISRGYDEETGMHFYQLFFREEE
ncbi:MAG: nucleoid-associated protein [Prevotellaceae bacterium]|jgi:antitoxin component HigA of HigAB toxin-antitoxin module|nr:nucleoid-associated protein [Prevotellaceae bacterium]